MTIRSVVRSTSWSIDCQREGNIPSKNRSATTNVNDLATLATKRSKKILNIAMVSFMGKCQSASDKILSHLKALSLAEVDVDEQSRVSMIIYVLAENRHIVDI